MARAIRIEYPGAVYHLMAWGPKAGQFSPTTWIARPG